MRKLIFIVVPVMLVMCLTMPSCSKKGPESVAEKFLTHTSKGEYEKAAELGTLQTKQLLAMASAFSEYAADDDLPNQDFKKLRCEVEGEKAECTYEVDGEEEYLRLVKENGKWLVHLEK